MSKNGRQFEKRSSRLARADTGRATETRSHKSLLRKAVIASTSHTLRELERAGEIVAFERIARPRLEPISSRGNGVHQVATVFLRSRKSGEPDILSRREYRTAMNGDRVVARSIEPSVTPGKDRQRSDGRVIRIRRRAAIRCRDASTFENFYYVVPDDPRIVTRLMFKSAANEVRESNARHKALFDPKTATRHVNPEAKSSKCSAPRTRRESTSSIIHYDLPDGVSQNVADEANRIPNRIGTNDRWSRGPAHKFIVGHRPGARATR